MYIAGAQHSLILTAKTGESYDQKKFDELVVQSQREQVGIF
jgi:hypothetical protein